MLYHLSRDPNLTSTNWGTRVIASPYCSACGALMKNGCN